MSKSDWKWTLAKLRPQDWDFRSEKIVESDRSDCFFYEYSREDEAFRRAVAASRKRHPDYEEKFRTQKLDPSWLAQPILPLAYTTNPKWPEAPFLSLPRIVRAEPEPAGTRFYAVRPWSLVDLVKAFFGKADYPGQPREKDWLESPTGGLWRCSEQSDLAAFEIPWHLPDDTLQKGFARWLRDHRPQGKPGDCRPQIRPTKQPTGAAAKARQFLPALKALGAYRLLECYDGERQKAKVYAEVLKILGKNYDHDCTWTEARQQVQEALKSVKKLNQVWIKREKFVGRSLLDTLSDLASSKFASTQKG